MKKIKELLHRLSNHSTFKEDYLRVLPLEYYSAAKLLFYRQLSMTAAEKSLGKKIEAFRNQIPKLFAQEEIQSYTSPYSDTFKLEEDSDHTVPGDFISTDVKTVMKTGSDIFKGTLLRRVVEGTQRKRVLELGINTGFANVTLFPSMELS